MNKKQKDLTSGLLGILGIIMFLMMAFNIIPGKGNLLIFLGIVCFLLAAFIRRLKKK